MKKVIILLLIFNFSFAKLVPYCAVENISPLETLDLITFLNEETQKVLKAQQEILQKQNELPIILDKKIQTLTTIKKNLIALIVLKKRINFELEKLIKLMQYTGIDNGKSIYK